MTTATDLIAEAFAIALLGSNVREATDIGTYAVECAIRNWKVFPLNGKVPAIAARDGGRGVLDATTDLLAIVTWWAGRYGAATAAAAYPSRCS